MGHVLMGIIFKWKIEKIIILPFGALTIFDEGVNKSIFEEFLIAIMGPIFQIIFTFFLYFLTYNDEVVSYSLTILIFNLLPIFPLDGSKILNLFLNEILNFKISHTILIIISVIFILTIILYSDFNLILILILTFLLVRVLLEIKNHESLFNRFLLERYLNHYNFKKSKKIYSMNLAKMKRSYKHLFFDGNRFISEHERLKKRFDFKWELW